MVGWGLNWKLKVSRFYGCLMLYGWLEPNWFMIRGREVPDWMGQDGDLIVCVACFNNMKIVCCWCDALGSSKMDCWFVY